MLRERIDEYLDDGLDPAAARELEAVVTRDPAAAKLLSQLKAERALRDAAYDSYRPTRQEATALAARVLDEAYHTPLGRVGYWIRHGSAVAAAVLVVAGSFMAGHMWAPERKVPVTVYVSDPAAQPREVSYIAVIEDARGNRAVSPSFRSAEEAEAFLRGRGNPMPPTVSDRHGPGKF